MLRPALRPLALAALAPLALPFLTSPAVAAATDDVSLGFAAGAGGRATSVNLASNGTAATASSLVTSDGGEATIAASATSSSGAIRLPAYTDGSASSPRAVVAVTNTGSADAMNPGAQAFAFGTDVRVDATSSGTSLDNGNNVMQRGLYDGSSQFKLQVEGGRASCRVMGPAGAIQVGVSVPSQAWYRLTCSLARSGTPTLTVRAAPIAADGTLGTARTNSRSGAVGTLTYARTVPLSVGGKLNDRGALAASADQFNGRLDNAWLRIG